MSVSDQCPSRRLMLVKRVAMRTRVKLSRGGAFVGGERRGGGQSLESHQDLDRSLPIT